MPLIETVTQPDMHTPQEVAEVANILRWSVRSTGKVRTGIGAARQDVNVSINGGTRVEIKGVHRIPLIPLLIYNEAFRQHSLLQIRSELNKRGITEKTFQANSAEVSHLLGNTHWEPFCQALSREEEIYCVNLKGFAGILSHTTQTGTIFSKEISDRVRVVACLTTLPNILTSEDKEKTIDNFAWNKIQEAVKGSSQDSFVLVWGNKWDVKTAVQEVIIRAREAAVGIPNETRQALVDGTNGFERILPGPNRMYPDTDLPPLEISGKLIQKLQKNVPERLWDRIDKYRGLRIPVHLHTPIASSNKAALFETITNTNHVPPARIACFLFEKTKAWRRKGLQPDRLSDDDWKLFFHYAEKQLVLLEVGEKIFTRFLRNKIRNLEKSLEEYVPPMITKKNLHEIINRVVNKNSHIYATVDKRHRFLMGKVMTECRGHIPAREVSRSLWDMLKGSGGKNE